MRNKSKVLLAIIGGLFFVVACGQKGPFYLPGRSSTFESMTPGQQPVPAEDSEEEDDEEQSNNIN